MLSFRVDRMWIYVDWFELIKYSGMAIKVSNRWDGFIYITV